MCFPGRRVRHIIVSVLIFAPAMAFSSGAFAGIIRTTISSHCTITASGDLDLRFIIQNKGNVAAHKMKATLKLAGVTRRFPHLGTNPPGGETAFEDGIKHPDWHPGVYVGILTASFEEQNGKTHLADHFFTVRYRITDTASKAAPLDLRAGSLVFNPKAFWKKVKPLRVTLKNSGDKGIDPALRLYLPEGFASPEAAGKHPLSPGSESVVTLPVVRNRNVESGKRFHLLAAYDYGGLHYTALLQGVIRMEKTPVLFKVYVVGSVAVILLLWGFLVVVGLKAKRDK